MKTTKFFKQVPGLLLVSGALIFSSCDNNNRTDRGTLGTDRDNVGTTDDRAVDTYEMTEADYNTRRNRVSTNLDNEINRTRTEVEGLRERANTASGAERDQLQQQIDRLDARIDNLESQQEQLDNSNMDNWDQTEREIETTIHNRENNIDHTEGRNPSMENRTDDRSSDLETGGAANTDTRSQY